jgi:hypothetical protein
MFKLAPLDFVIIFVMILLVALIFFFFGKETVVSVDADGKVADVAYVKKGLFSQPKAKVGELFKKEKEKKQ